MQAMLDQLSNKQAMGFIDQFGDLFKSSPSLPKNWIEFLVKIAPYLAIISATVMLIGGPLIGLLGTFGSILSLSPMFMIWTLLTVIFMLAEAILKLLAFAPLKERQMKGWIYLFWSEVISVIGSLLSVLNGDYTHVVWAIIFSLISFYIFFQMRPFYKSGVVA